MLTIEITTQLDMASLLHMHREIAQASIAIFLLHAFGRLSKILFSTDIASVSSRSQSLEAWITCPIEELGQQAKQVLVMFYTED